MKSRRINRISLNGNINTITIIDSSKNYLASLPKPVSAILGGSTIGSPQLRHNVLEGTADRNSEFNVDKLVKVIQSVILPYVS